MKKKVISNTIIFLVILLFVKGFELIFGSNNSLVGVTIIISILVLMQEDLTKNLSSNLIKLLFMNLISGVFSNIATNNMYLGLVLNFIILLLIGYSLTSKLNKVMVVPFGLQYLFMLYTPVEGSDFTKRLVGLAIGAILIMLVQLVIYKGSKNNKVEDSEIENNINNENKEENEYVRVFNKVNIHHVRGAYAIRIALLTAIAVFIVDFFNLAQGRWIVYTIFSLTELYSEHCRVRSKQRLQGTVIGIIIIMLLFIVIKDNTIRGLIVLLGGYLDTYTTNYRDKIICVTMSVVASVSLTNGTITTAIERVGYICIGIILALLADKLVFNKKLECGDKLI
ncbi:MAG: FUSC family protein [Clostridium celatum]|nr:FUSC family protein [Clostridium celatum]MDU4978456.1 FUSC family protein [Clostridium celatum]